MNTFQQKPSINFKPTFEEFFTDISKKQTIIISGSNNTGKSLILKKLHIQLGERSCLLACQRFFNSDRITTRTKEDSENMNHYNNFVTNFNNSTQNDESSYFQLNQLITDLTSDQLEKLLTITSDLIGSEFTLKDTRPGYPLTDKYIQVDGHNLSFASAGTRLLMTMIAVLISEEHEYVLLDEPELGLTPRIQNKLSDLIFDLKRRSESFPRLKSLVIATHSHLFLDRDHISNNYSLKREANNIEIENISSIIEFHRLQFNLLGNNLESLFLPSLFVLVEGGTDFKFINKVLTTTFPDKRISVINCLTENKVFEELSRLEKILGNLSDSPYRERVMIVFDSTHSKDQEDSISKKGIPKENVIVWDKNGIEFYYPKSIIAKIYHCNETEVDKMIVKDDKATIDGNEKIKGELASEVISKIEDSTTYNTEFKNKFLTRISKILD